MVQVQRLGRAAMVIPTLRGAVGGCALAGLGGPLPGMSGDAALMARAGGGQLSRSRKSRYPTLFTFSSRPLSESHSQIEGSGTPLKVVVLTIE